VAGCRCSRSLAFSTNSTRANAPCPSLFHKRCTRLRPPLGAELWSSCLSINPRCGLGRNVIARPVRVRALRVSNARRPSSTPWSPQTGACGRMGIYTTMRAPILCVPHRPRLCLRTSPSSTTCHHVSVAPTANIPTDYKYSPVSPNSAHLIHLGTHSHQINHVFINPKVYRGKFLQASRVKVQIPQEEPILSGFAP
jgi:hypothetical protein